MAVNLLRLGLGGMLPLAVASACAAKEPAPVAPLAAPVLSAPAAPADAAPGAQPRTILFIGNSFTQGAHSALRNWRAHTVEDLNQAGSGGVPALFKTFAAQAGMNYTVSLETQGGKTLGFHYDERRQLFDRAWDVVVLQELSTLDRARPGDPTSYFRDVARLSSLFNARNPAVEIQLMATWTRADQTYKPNGHWYGKPVAAMAEDLRAAADRARAITPGIAGVLPVGQAWNRAFAAGVADPNPYDGVSFGQLDLWAYDQYHASVAGYYLEALVVFGGVTGIDPTTLGPLERAAGELGLSPAQAKALQKVASDELARGGPGRKMLSRRHVAPEPGASTGNVAARFDGNTPIETIAADPTGWEVLARIIPSLLTHPSYEQFKALSLRQLQAVSGGQLSADDVARADAALRAATTAPDDAARR